MELFHAGKMAKPFSFCTNRSEHSWLFDTPNLRPQHHNLNLITQGARWTRKSTRHPFTAHEHSFLDVSVCMHLNNCFSSLPLHHYNGQVNFAVYHVNMNKIILALAALAPTASADYILQSTIYQNTYCSSTPSYQLQADFGCQVSGSTRCLTSLIFCARALLHLIRLLSLWLSIYRACPDAPISVHCLSLRETTGVCCLPEMCLTHNSSIDSSQPHWATFFAIFFLMNIFIRSSCHPWCIKYL